MQIVLVALFALGMSGCSYSTYFVPKQAKVYGPTSPSTIAVSTQQDLQYPFEKLGRVAVIVWGDGDEARSSLQETGVSARSQCNNQYGNRSILLAYSSQWISGAGIQ